MEMQYDFATGTELLEKVTHHLAFAKRDEVDFISRQDAQMHNRLFRVENFVVDFDLKRWFLTKYRWSAIIHQYVNPDVALAWAEKGERLRRRVRGINLMPFNQVAMQVRKVTSRRWGGCLVTLSYRTLPRPTITLHSRATYFGYLAPLDMNVAYNLAKLISPVVNVPVEEMAFNWFVEAGQYHHFRCMAYAMGDPELRNELLANPPSIEDSFGIGGNMVWYNKLQAMNEKGVRLDENLFATTRRMRKRLAAEVHGNPPEFMKLTVPSVRGCKHYDPLPHMSNHDLSFAPIGIIQP